MSDERRKHGWPFWFALLVIGLVLYAASLGPACWLSSCRPVGTGETSAWSARTVSLAYRPMMWVYDISPEFIRASILSYSKSRASPFWGWTKDNRWASLTDNASLPKDMR